MTSDSAKHPVEVDQLAAFGLGEVRVAGQHPHPHRRRRGADPASDAAVPHQPQHRAVELQRRTGRGTRQTLAGALDLRRQVLHHGEHQHQRVLGGRDRRSIGGVAHDHAGRGRGGDVDVVVADADA